MEITLNTMRILLLLSLLFSLSSASAQQASFNPYFSHNIQLGMGYGGSSGNAGNDGFFFGFQFDYSGLYKLTPKLAFGAGTGVRHVVWSQDFFNLDNDPNRDITIQQSILIPIYAQAKFRFTEKKISPFLIPSLGYNIYAGSLGSINVNDFYEKSHLGSGFMANVHAGVSIRFDSGIQVVAGPYFDYFNSRLVRDSSHQYIGDYSNISSRQSSNSSSLNLFQGGVKVGLSF